MTTDSELICPMAVVQQQNVNRHEQQAPAHDVVSANSSQPTSASYSHSGSPHVSHRPSFCPPVQQTHRQIKASPTEFDSSEYMTPVSPSEPIGRNGPQDASEFDNRGASSVTRGASNVLQHCPIAQSSTSSSSPLFHNGPPNAGTDGNASVNNAYHGHSNASSPTVHRDVNGIDSVNSGSLVKSPLRADALEFTPPKFSQNISVTQGLQGLGKMLNPNAPEFVPNPTQSAGAYTHPENPDAPHPRVQQLPTSSHSAGAFCQQPHHMQSRQPFLVPVPFHQPNGPTGLRPLAMAGQHHMQCSPHGVSGGMPPGASGMTQFYHQYAHHVPSMADPSPAHLYFSTVMSPHQPMASMNAMGACHVQPNQHQQAPVYHHTVNLPPHQTNSSSQRFHNELQQHQVVRQGPTETPRGPRVDTDPSAGRMFDASAVIPDVSSGHPHISGNLSAAVVATASSTAESKRNLKDDSASQLHSTARGASTRPPGASVGQQQPPCYHNKSSAPPISVTYYGPNGADCNSMTTPHGTPLVCAHPSVTGAVRPAHFPMYKPVPSTAAPDEPMGDSMTQRRHSSSCHNVNHQFPGLAPEHTSTRTRKGSAEVLSTSALSSSDNAYQSAAQANVVPSQPPPSIHQPQHQDHHSFRPAMHPHPSVYMQGLFGVGQPYTAGPLDRGSPMRPPLSGASSGTPGSSVASATLHPTPMYSA